MTINHFTKSGNCVRHFGCDRPECIDRRRAYSTKRQNLYRMGRTTTVPLGPVRERVAELYAQGYSQAQICRAAKCKEDTLISLMKPSYRWLTVNGDFAARILACKITEPPRGRVPVVGTQRRLRSLARDGYSQVDLSRMIREREETPSCTSKWVSEVQQGKYKRVSAQRHFLVEDLFEKLVLTPGTSNFARTVARRMGYCRPLAWEPEDIDNPDAPVPPDEDDWICAGHYAVNRANGPVMKKCTRRLVTNYQYAYLMSPPERRAVSPHAGLGCCPRCYRRPGQRVDN